MVQPDFKLPVKQPAVAEGRHDEQELSWTEKHAAFPFWGIMRQEKGGEWNCEVVKEDVMVLVSSHPNQELQHVGFAETFTASLPLIVNRKPIKAGDEVILQWVTEQKEPKEPKAKPPKRERPQKTWADELASKVKKMKTSEKKNGSDDIQ